MVDPSVRDTSDWRLQSEAHFADQYHKQSLEWRRNHTILVFLCAVLQALAVYTFPFKNNYLSLFLACLSGLASIGIVVLETRNALKPTIREKFFHASLTFSVAVYTIAATFWEDHGSEEERPGFWYILSAALGNLLIYGNSFWCSLLASRGSATWSTYYEVLWNDPSRSSEWEHLPDSEKAWALQKTQDEIVRSRPVNNSTSQFPQALQSHGPPPDPSLQPHSGLPSATPLELSTALPPGDSSGDCVTPTADVPDFPGPSG